jgi:phosphatidylserine/phosphatidylglycerophosphate/cardiolipin synthase-like enzyme
MISLVLPHLQRLGAVSADLIHSKLYNEATFYQKFASDLKHCRKEVIIESPYITSQRMYHLKPTFKSLVDRKVKVYVVTRDPNDHDILMRKQAELEIRWFQTIGVQVIISSNHNHRKLAILDRKVLWEGSLNILSQGSSREIMRRIDSESQAKECFEFINLGRYVY